jgi:hypothetical protein
MAMVSSVNVSALKKKPNEGDLDGGCAQVGKAKRLERERSLAGQ